MKRAYSVRPCVSIEVDLGGLDRQRDENVAEIYAENKYAENNPVEFA
jgi:hypothetical protein